MATQDAVHNTCEAIIRLLRSRRNPEAFAGDHLDIDVYGSANFGEPMLQGVSLFLYRVYHNGSHRIPPGRLVGSGRQKRKLPVDLHFFLTAWAQTAPRQHEIAGWMMRVMEDSPVLPAGILNAPRPGVFQPDEAVEIVLADLSTEDLFRIWEVVIDREYQLSVPYVARRLEIESEILVPARERIGERIPDIRQIKLAADEGLVS